jgi:hypothetical protein
MKFYKADRLNHTLLLLILSLSCSFYISNAWSATTTTRRQWAGTAAAATTSLLFPAIAPPPSLAVGLAEKLNKRDPTVLVNSVFNMATPGVQVYPNFMRGTWNVTSTFGGFLFPSQKISRQRVTANSQIPGFQKCSIAAISDVGENVQYQMQISETTGLEDRKRTLASQINANLGYSAVKEILYSPKTNPNRLSIDFVDYSTVNAERIELFYNARESEFFRTTATNNKNDIGGGGGNVFVCSEHVRQVTFGTGSQVGVPRQAVGNYAHFWTWRQPPSINTNPDDPLSKQQPQTLTGNLLTAAYLDPQDAMFFEEPSKPVAVYSHVLTATRVS